MSPMPSQIIPVKRPSGDGGGGDGGGGVDLNDLTDGTSQLDAWQSLPYSDPNSLVNHMGHSELVGRVATSYQGGAIDPDTTVFSETVRLNFARAIFGLLNPTFSAYTLAPTAAINTYQRTAVPRITGRGGGEGRWKLEWLPLVGTAAVFTNSTTADGAALKQYANGFLRVDATGPVTVTLTDTQDADADGTTRSFPTGTYIDVYQQGTGTVSFATGPGTTIVVPDTYQATTRGRYMVARAILVDATPGAAVWALSGDLAGGPAAGGGGPANAAALPSTPAGNIAATNVQAAVDELDAKKAAKAGDTFNGQVNFTRTNTTDITVTTRRVADANPRLRITADGNIGFSSGATGSYDPTIYSDSNSRLHLNATQVNLPNAAATLSIGGLFAGNRFCIANASTNIPTGAYLWHGATFTTNQSNYRNVFVTSDLTATGRTFTGGVYPLEIGAMSFTGTGNTIPEAMGIKVGSITAVPATIVAGIGIAEATTATLWLATATNPTTPAGGITFGLARDTNLYRAAADTLKTDDKLVVGQNIALNGITTPPAQSTGWNMTAGYTALKTFNPASASIDEVARTVATLIDYLKARGDIA